MNDQLKQRFPSFNGLSNAEVERLSLLAEECAEVIQIIGKILRHGYYSTHPDNPDGPHNADMLETELGHIEAAKKLMFDAADIDRAYVSQAKKDKLRSVQVYLHHN